MNISACRKKFATHCRRMQLQKVSEFAKHIPIGYRKIVEVVLRIMRVAACGILQLLAQNPAQRTARDCGNFEIFKNNPPLVNIYLQVGISVGKYLSENLLTNW